MGKAMNIDWTACSLVERVPGRCGGRPTIKGTRIEPDAILIEEEYGRTPEETHASFPELSIEVILKLRTFAHEHQLTT
jgi:uncharacterized protein (DUF433 family)